MTVVICWGFSQVLGRAFYAHEDTLTPVLLGTGVTVLAIGVFYALARTWQVNGVAVASALSITNYTLALGLVWRRRFGAEAFRGIGKSALLISVFSVLAAGAGYPLTRLSLSLLAAHPVLEALWEIALSGVGFGAVFLVLVRLFAPQFLAPFLNRMGRFGKLFSS